MLITNTFRHDILARFWHDSSMSVRDLILLINPVNGPIGLWLAMNLELCCEQPNKNLATLNDWKLMQLFISRFAIYGRHLIQWHHPNMS